MFFTKVMAAPTTAPHTTLWQAMAAKAELLEDAKAPKRDTTWWSQNGPEMETLFFLSKDVSKWLNGKVNKCAYKTLRRIQQNQSYLTSSHTIKQHSQQSVIISSLTNPGSKKREHYLLGTNVPEKTSDIMLKPPSSNLLKTNLSALQYDMSLEKVQWPMVPYWKHSITSWNCRIRI